MQIKESPLASVVLPVATSMQLLISQERTGQLNRSRLLQILYDIGPASRTELARIADVAKSTIGSIVQPLIDQGVLVEQEARPSGVVGGKPARPIWFSPDGTPIIAVHVMPDSVRASLVSPTGKIRSLVVGSFSGVDGSHAAIVAEIQRCVDEVLPTVGPRPLGIGVAVGGLVDTESGTVVKVNLAPFLSGLVLGPLLKASTGLPVYIDVHSRVQALGDRWFGNGRRVTDFVSIYCAEVIGAGFVIDGTVHRGKAGSGGEVGHTIVDMRGELCRCGKRGCWETVASHRWLRRRAEELGLQLPAAESARHLFELEHSDSSEILIDEYAQNIAVGLVNLQQTFGSDRFIMHGDSTSGGEPFRLLIEQYLLRGIAHHPGVRLDVEFADDRIDITTLGATGLVLSNLLERIT